MNLTEAYEKGIKDALLAYSWTKTGERYVGGEGILLQRAVDEIRLQDYYQPPGHKDGYVAMLVKAQPCPSCDKTMVHPPHRRKPFPVFFQLTFEKQLADMGLVIQSQYLRDAEYICTECAEAGKAGFTCALCEEWRSNGTAKESYGDPSEHLCTPCFETVSAKIWQEAKDRLYEEHKYDFE